MSPTFDYDTYKTIINNPPVLRTMVFNEILEPTVNKIQQSAHAVIDVEFSAALNLMATSSLKNGVVFWGEKIKDQVSKCGTVLPYIGLRHYQVSSDISDIIVDIKTIVTQVWSDCYTYNLPSRGALSMFNLMDWVTWVGMSTDRQKLRDALKRYIQLFMAASGFLKAGVHDAAAQYVKLITDFVAEPAYVLSKEKDDVPVLTEALKELIRIGQTQTPEEFANNVMNTFIAFPLDDDVEASLVRLGARISRQTSYYILSRSEYLAYLSALVDFQHAVSVESIVARSEEFWNIR